MSKQLRLDFETPDPWREWVKRPTGPRERLDDLILQIKRDLATLKMPPSFRSADGFIEERLKRYQEDAKKLAEQIERDG